MKKDNVPEKDTPGLPAIRKLIEKEILSKKDDIEHNKWLVQMQKFATILNTDVEETNLEQHPVAKKARYLPISFMEMSLDMLFFGLWETVNFKWLVVANEITASIELRVFHPYAKIWITRTGAMATAIMTDSIPEDQEKQMTRQ